VPEECYKGVHAEDLTEIKKVFETLVSDSAHEWTWKNYTAEYVAGMHKKWKGKHTPDNERITDYRFKEAIPFVYEGHALMRLTFEGTWKRSILDDNAFTRQLLDKYEI
jgi:hypothetical protein